MDDNQAREWVEGDQEALGDAQDLLWSTKSRALLIVLQGMDASGKDSLIKHVMSGLNPRGCETYSFGPPTPEEQRHHFLWRSVRRLPAKGRIGIFNRSYYEEVIVVRVHPEWLDAQNIPSGQRGEELWRSRYEDINGFERMLTRNGTCILKFFLHLSREEQKKRFLKRLRRRDKHWKFDANDLRERAFWDQYVEAYDAALTATNTAWAPWYILPADHKWHARALAADYIAARVRALGLKLPPITAERRAELEAARRRLNEEDE